MILAPVIVKDKDATPRPGHATKPDEAVRVAGFRTAYVFDISQTEGKPLPEFAQTTGDPKEYGERLKALVARQGINLTYDRSIAPAQGISAGGTIRLVPGLAPAEEFSVLTHEMAHEMLHHRADAAPIPTVVRETQAEAVAFVVCRGVGLETNSAAADYIALYNGDKKTLAESLSVIQEASSKILDDLLPDRERISSPQKASGPAASGSRSVPEDAGPKLPQSPAPDSADVSNSMVWDR